MSEVTAEVAVPAEDGGEARLGAEPDEPAWIEAVLHPERFFRAPEMRLRWSGAVAVLVVGGIAGASGLLPHANGPIRQPAGGMPDLYSGLGLLTGALTPGAVRWCLATFWYWLGLRLSGVTEFRGSECRDVAGVCVLVKSAPFVARVLAGAARLESPLQVMRSGDTVLGMVASLAVEGWAIWMAYQAGCVRHDLRVGRARFWLLVMPALFTIGLTAFVFRRFRS